MCVCSFCSLSENRTEIPSVFIPIRKHSFSSDSKTTPAVDTIWFDNQKNLSGKKQTPHPVWYHLQHLIVRHERTQYRQRLGTYWATAFQFFEALAVLLDIKLLFPHFPTCRSCDFDNSSDLVCHNGSAEWLLCHCVLRKNLISAHISEKTSLFLKVQRLWCVILVHSKAFGPDGKDVGILILAFYLS